MFKFIRKSFRRELVTGFVIVAVIPFVIICSLLVQSVKIIFSEEQKSEAGEIQIEANSAVTNFFNLFDQITIEIEKNQNIISFINSTDNWERKQVYSELYEETDAIREIVQVDIYNKQGICKYSTGNEPIENNMPLYCGILNKAVENPDKISYLDYKKYGNNDVNETLLVGAKPIMYEGNIKGFIVLELHDENFSKLFQGIYNSRDGVAVISKYWNEIYISEVAEKENIVEKIRNRLFDNERVETSIDGYTPCISEILDTGIYILFLQPEILSKSNLNSMYQIIFVFALLSFLLSLLVVNILSKRFMIPVKQLSGAMHEIEGGNLDIRIHDKREDEFGILYSDFNEMTLKMKNFTEQRVQNEKDINTANIAMMHAQLNPHFLYNTLDTIKWIGKINNIPQVSKMATSLAKILRMSISIDKFIYLENEMSFVKSYIEIQQIRFDNQFTYDYMLPDELAKLKVPKLIVQPIVENAILHGISEKQGGNVSVKCFKVDDVLNIEVTDNGCGIDEDVLDSLNSKEENKLKNHIGFYNVNKIIRLSYGEKYGLKVEGIEEGGTKVILRMPVIEGE
ncbi:MAG: sensor histidine kinase [Clostridiaceae bacterium]